MVHSQNSLGTNQNATSRALNYFNSEEFAAVVQLLGESAQSSTDKLLVEMSKVNLGGTAPDRLEALQLANKEHHLNSQANFTIGKYYFQRNSSRLAEKSLKTVDASSLSEMNRGYFYFMRGYMEMKNGAFKIAQNYFSRARKINLSDDSKLAYYQGFTAYHLGQEKSALSHLKQVQNDPEFGVSARFFIAKIYLDNEQYSEVITLAKSELSNEKSVTNAEFNQLIGEAYALQDQANKAFSHFEKAIELHPGTPLAVLYYQAGVASFKIGLKDKAITYLTDAGIRSGEYAHLSAFQLGRLYVSSNNKEKAVGAFIEASASRDISIKEEAVFKSGKLLLDQKNYSEGIKYLEDYRREFKTGKWRSESENLLAQAYLRTSNYDQAIAHLNEIGIDTEANRRIYQKVTFQKANLLFSDGLFNKSIRWFRESLKYPDDQTLRDNAYFNLAEAHFNLSDFDNAITSYESQSQKSAESIYGLAYANFNLGRYSRSIGHFENFISSRPTRELKYDAELRLADAYYATKAYEQALSLYTSIARTQESSYIVFQIGIVNRNLERKEDAIAAFERVVQMKTDSITDDAIYQIAQLRFESAEFEQAEFYFGSLISKYGRSSLVPEAYLNRAISRTNLSKLDEAKGDFQYIVNNHIDSKVAFNAILGLQELQSRGVEVSGIEDFIAKYRNANPNDDSLEVIEFEYAKSQYFNLKYGESSASFTKFVQDYPGSSYNDEAKYYLADSYYRSGELESARKHFNDIKQVRGKFSGRIFSRLGDINFQLGNHDEALDAYGGLVDLELTPKDNYNGRLGLMNTYFAKGSFDSCLLVADVIVNAEWKPLNGERNAMLVKGRANILLQNIDQGKEDLETLKDGDDRISAEASFLLAKLQFDQSEHQESIELLFDFNSKFGSYQDLIDQSYLLIADNYIQMDELFQAKATLRSIIQHSENEEVRFKAQNQLSLIENQNLEDSTTNKQ